MRSFLLLIVLLICAEITHAQITVTKIDKKDIPATIKYAGHIIDEVKYTDSEGEHLVITTETGWQRVKTKDFEGKSMELFAYSYLRTGDDYKLLWKTYDGEKACEFDVFAGFIPKTFEVTDLNNDGKAEVWLMYVVVCTSDVSPEPMKIIMHDGVKKYAVRGENRVDGAGGKYTFDEAFKTGPEVFRNYATTLWKKNIAVYDKTKPF